MSTENLGRQLRNLRKSKSSKPRVVFRDEHEQYLFNEDQEESSNSGVAYSDSGSEEKSNSQISVAGSGLSVKTKMMILAVASAVAGIGVYVKQSPPVDIPPEELKQLQASARTYALIAAGGTAILLGYVLFWRKTFG